MSAAALALSFFDPAHEIYGTARSGATILFEGRRPRAVPEGPVIEKTNGAVTARIDGELDLQVEPLSEPADLGEAAVSICQVRGEAAGRDGRLPGHPGGDDLAAALGGARRAAHRVRARGRGARAAAPGPASARRTRARRRTGERHADRRGQLQGGRGGAPVHGLRRRRAPAQRRAGAVAAGRGVSPAGLRDRPGRHLPRAGRAGGARRGVSLADRRPRGHRRLRAHHPHRTSEAA